MRKAICHYSFHRRWAEEKWSPQRLVDEVSALGVEGIDFHAGLLRTDPQQAPKVIRGAMHHSGLTLSGLSLGNDFNQKDPSAFQAQVEQVKAWMGAGAEVGAPVMRIFGGRLSFQNRSLPDLVPESLDRIRKALALVVADAERLDVTLALENHGGLPCLAEEQVALIREINSPNLKATVDFGNYLNGGQEGHVAAQLAAPDCAYAHMKDFKKIVDSSAPFGRALQPTAPGEGDVDQRACLKALADCGYNGFVALEYEGVEPEVSGVPKSVAFMNEIMA